MSLMDTNVDGPEVLTRAEAITLVETRKVGRLAYTRNALPAVMPVNYAVRNGGIEIWAGSAFALARGLSGTVVAFQVDDLAEAMRPGWTVTVTAMAQSVRRPGAVAGRGRGGPDPHPADDGCRPPAGRTRVRRIESSRPGTHGRLIGLHRSSRAAPGPSLGGCAV
jgi:hypothetical protein